MVKHYLIAENNICIILDNAWAHCTDYIYRNLEEKKVQILFTAPYSPQLNMIEIMFGLMKEFVRKQGKTTM